MIEYKGLKKLNTLQIKDIQAISKTEFTKIKREIKGNKNASLFIDIHTAEKTGNRIKYSYHLKVTCPNTILTSKETDWDHLKALHKAFDNIKVEVTHKFKDEQTPRKKKVF